MRNVFELAEVDVNEEEDEWSAGGGETQFEDGEEELDLEQARTGREE